MYPFRIFNLQDLVQETSRRFLCGKQKVYIYCNIYTAKKTMSDELNIERTQSLSTTAICLVARVNEHNTQCHLPLSHLNRDPRNDLQVWRQTAFWISVRNAALHSATSISSSFSLISPSSSEPSMSELITSAESPVLFGSPLSSPDGDSYLKKST